MRISYRQGLVAAQTGFLQINGNNGIDLVISPIPVLATIANGANFDYLIGEYHNVTSAWGPFSGSATQYLYWQIDPVSGSLERNATTLPYVLSATAPLNPVEGQLWWDSVNLINKEWTGVFWNPVLIVFAATLHNGANLVPQALASQVGINGVEIYAGYVLTDGFGGVFTDNFGNLLTTETPVISPNTGSEVKLDNALLVLQASENIAAFTLVYINAGTVAIASSAIGDNLSQAPIGMVTVPVYQNDAVSIATAGQMVVNQQWAFTTNQIGSIVYCDDNGQVTLTQPGTSQYVRVGIITGAQNILLTLDWITSPPLQGQPTGTVSQVLAVSPVTIGGSASYPVVELPQVTTLQDGYLSAVDYTTFVGYSSAISQKATLNTLWPQSSIIGLSNTLAQFASVNATWPQSSIQGLAATLSGYAPLSATWQISSVVGLQAQLNSINVSLGNKLSAVTNGVAGNFTSLTSGGSLLDSGYSPASFALANATWPQSSIQGLATTLSDLAPLTTVWPISSIVGLQSALNSVSGKANIVSPVVAGNFASLTSSGDLADSGYSHAAFAPTNATWPISSIVGLQSALNNTLTLSSQISIGQITNLNSTLNTFMIAGTAIPISQVTGLQTSLNSFLPKSGGTMTGTLVAPSLTIGSALAVASTGALSIAGSTGTVGQVLTSAGPGVPPTWSTVTSGGGGGGGSSLTVNVATAANNANYFPTLVSASAGNQQLYASNNTGTFFYTPSSNSLTVGTIIGNLTGNATSANSAISANNIAGGSVGSVPYQAGPGVTSLLSPGIAGQVFTSTGPGSAPAWTTFAQHTSTSAPANQILFGDQTGTTVTSNVGFTFNPVSQTLNVSTIASSSPITINGSTFTVQTSNVSQFGIDATGTWYVNNNIGSAGQFLTSSGPGSPPTWSNFSVPGASAPPGQVLFGDQTGTTTVSSSNLTFNSSTNTLTVEYINGQISLATNANNLIGGANGSIPFQSVTGDYLWSNVSLLLDGIGINGSTNFVDQSNYSNTINFTGATISANQALYGSTSISFPGVNSEIAVPVAGNGPLNFVANSFTVELAVFNSLSSYAAPVGLLGIGFPSSGSYGLDIYIDSSTGNLTAIIGLSSGTPGIAVGPSVPFGAWAQIAVCFNTATMTLTCWVNGTPGAPVVLPVAPSTYASTFGGASTSLFLGADGGHNALFGYMDQVRITQGVARYTTSYTPPSAAFSIGGGAATELLPIGTTGQILSVVSGVPAWVTGGGSGGGVSDASQLTGTTLASSVVNSSLTSVGTLTSLTVSGTVTGTFVGSGAALTGTAAGLNIGGTAALATSLAGGSSGSISYQTAPGTSAMLPIGSSGQVLKVVSGSPSWVTPSSVDAGNLVGATLAANVLSSSLTSVGTLTSLTVAGTISGSFSGAGTGLTGTAAGLSIGGTAAGNLLLSGGTLTGPLLLAADPTASKGAATKNYVDNSAMGLAYHAAVATATTANITLSGEQTIDGVTTSNSRVLVKNQTDPTTNGIYVSGTGAWTRASDANNSAGLQNAAVFVNGGTTQASSTWVFSTGSSTVTIGTTPINFYQSSASTSYGAGTGISLTGSVFANTGVLSLIAGTGVTLSGSTGAITISSTGAIASVNGTTNQITASTSSGVVTLSLPATINVNTTGNAASATTAVNATTATNLAGGSAGAMPYQSANGVTSLLAAGTAGQVLTSGGAAHPVWMTPTSAIPVIATSAITAAAYNMIVADTSSGSFTITLPASPVFGQRVYFIDGAGTWGTSPLMITGNGANINGSSLNLMVTASRDNFSLFYYNSAQGWIIGVN